MISFFQHASDIADRITSWAIAPIVAFFTLLLILSVFSRYVFQLPIVTSVELTRLTFVWGTFLGAAAGVKGKSHVRVVAFVSLLPRGLQQQIRYLVHGAVLLFALLLVWYGLKLTTQMAGTSFPALGISQSWLFGVMPVSGVLIALHAIAALLARDPVELSEFQPTDTGHEESAR